MNWFKRLLPRKFKSYEEWFEAYKADTTWRDKLKPKPWWYGIDWVRIAFVVAMTSMVIGGFTLVVIVSSSLDGPVTKYRADCRAAGGRVLDTGSHIYCMHPSTMIRIEGDTD